MRDSKFPNLKISVFIHQLYSVKAFLEVGKAILPGQIPYVTAVDLAFELKKITLLSEKSYQGFIQILIPKILKEDDAVILLFASAEASLKYIACITLK